MAGDHPVLPSNETPPLPPRGGEEPPGGEGENKGNVMDDDSLVKWCQTLQEKALRREMKTEKYGITRTERAYFRKLLGYEAADSEERKNVSTAGGYTIEALNLHQRQERSAEEENQTDVTQHNKDMDIIQIGEQDIHQQRRSDLGCLPSIFSQVNGSLAISAADSFGTFLTPSAKGREERREEGRKGGRGKVQH